VLKGCSSDSVIPGKQAWDILGANVSGSKFANKTGEFKPKAAASVRAICVEESGSLSCLTEISTGKPSNEHIDG
jgi:hypothetical protein